MGYIYKIENLKNGKVYIGQTKRPNNRWKDHIAGSKNRNRWSYNKPLYADMRKLGVQSFIFSILEECDDSNMNAREAYWIEAFDSQNEEHGYNIYGGGRGDGIYITRPVLQYDLDGNYIATYTNQCVASRHTGLDNASIGKVCNGKMKSCGGFLWTYSKADKPRPYKKQAHYIKPVIQCDINGKALRKFDSLKDAGRFIGVNSKSISDCCKGKKTSCAGYVWRFAQKQN